MNCSLPVDWLYVRVTLQLLRTAGTIEYKDRQLNEKITKSKTVL